MRLYAIAISSFDMDAKTLTGAAGYVWSTTYKDAQREADELAKTRYPRADYRLATIYETDVACTSSNVLVQLKGKP